AEALVHALDKDEQGLRLPTSLSQVSQRLFGDASPEVREAAFELMLDALATGVDAPSEMPVPARFRNHMFVRLVRGIWACVNPDCDAVPLEQRGHGRVIGRLYTDAIGMCECGSVVLELLYCFRCGDVS